MATAKNSTKSATTAKPLATKPEQGNKPKGLKVVPKRAGFRRAGFAFPDGETTLPLADLSDEQYAQLTTEPMLVTLLVDLDVPATDTDTATA